MSISASCHIIPQQTQEKWLRVYQKEAEKVAEEGGTKKEYWNNIVNAQIASINTCFQNKETNPHTGGPGYLSGKKWWTGYQAGRPGSIEKKSPYTWDRYDWGRLSLSLINSPMQVWDLSFLARNPTLLMENKFSIDFQWDSGYLSHKAGFFKRKIAYRLASFIYPEYTSAPQARACWDNMQKVYDFFNYTFFEHPIDIENNKFRCYINNPMLDNAGWYPPNQNPIYSSCMHFGQPFACNDMTGDLSILAHEMGHSIVQCAGGLHKSNEPGALNESIADVFSIMVQHKQANVMADGPDTKWLIAEGIRRNSIGGTSLRSMKDPGSGCLYHQGDRDTSVGHMRDFRHLPAWDEPDEGNDEGYIHSNCGIPSRAFVLAAERIGGVSYGHVGRIWHRVIFSISRNENFTSFANKTMKACQELNFNNGIYNKLGQSWMDVGVDLRHCDKPENNHSECTIL